MNQHFSSLRDDEIWHARQQRPSALWDIINSVVYQEAISRFGRNSLNDWRSTKTQLQIQLGVMLRQRQIHRLHRFESNTGVF